jgi:hypothetical protein
MSNDTIQTATPLLSTNQTFNDSLSSSDLNDYFQFTLTTRSSISLMLENLTADANVQLLDVGGFVLQSSTNQGQAAELIGATLNPGTYYIRAFLGNSSTANYTLDLQLQPGGQLNTLWRDYQHRGNHCLAHGWPQQHHFKHFLTDSDQQLGRSRAIADWNQDGIQDIFWRDYINGNNGIWLMASNATIASILPLPYLTSNWDCVGVADFNRDGTLDILWREVNNGTNGFWFMGGPNNDEITGYGGLPDLQLELDRQRGRL